MSVKKVTTDFKNYLDDIELLSRKLEPAQKDTLETLLAAQLTLLVAFKHDSRLGKVDFAFFEKDPKKKSKRRRYTTLYDEEED